MRFACAYRLVPCLLLISSGSLFSQTGKEDVGAPLNVYVTAKTIQPVDSATKKQLQKELKGKASEAKDRKKALEKQLKSELGGDKDKWPPEKREELLQAEDTEKMILLELESLDVKQKDLDDTVGDIKRSIQGEGMAKVKKYIRLVETPEEADLTAEVLGRRKEGGGGLVACADCSYFVYLKVTPEAGIRSENLGGLAPKTGFLVGVRRIHQYQDQEPFWILEAASTGRWGNAANQGAGALNNFIEDNQTVLKRKSGQF